ncbi:MAG: ribose-phosphate diphosphokinase [Candidatus Aenigmarchaeota archaeon]|nr:ribose-phosphate diphosphokinase [Candidatus Aenigmarchaeota archaeon]
MKTIALTSRSLAEEVAKGLDSELLFFNYGSHGDKELSLSYNGNINVVAGEEFLIIQSTYPDDQHKMFDALAALPPYLKRNGAIKVYEFIPYLAFLSQSEIHLKYNEVPIAESKLRQFNGRDTNKHLYLDGLFVVNPHDAKTLATYCAPFRKILDDTELIANELNKFDIGDAAVIAPDENALNQAVALARRLGVPYGSFYKKRISESQVQVVAKGRIPKASTYFIRDDTIRGGTTISEVAKKLKKKFSPEKMIAVCSHPIMLEGSVEILTEAGITEIIGTNSIPGPYSRISVAPLIVSQFSNPDL